MPGFESLIGQEHPVRLLTNLLQNRTIPHALLFTGIEGVGKRTAALMFAMACNCTNNRSECYSEHNKTIYCSNGKFSAASPCGRCRSCKKIQSGNHPDIIRIKPSGHSIKIAQIRALCHTLAMKPYEAGMRVVIISDAHAMNPEAGNALLKVLEEPPDRTILILTAAQTSDLLPTVVSRCQHIRFYPVSRKSLETYLIDKYEFDMDDANIIAVLANGSISKALFMIDPKNKTDWKNIRNWLINEVESLSLRSIGSILAFADRLSRNKDTLLDSLGMIKSWMRDLIVCKYCPDKIINNDLRDRIQCASQKTTATSLLEKIRAIETAIKDIRANSNLRLTMEVLVIRLAKLENS